MKKLFLWGLLLLFLVIGVVGYSNYPKLNLITGFAAKNVCSCTFEAGRELESIQEGDNGFAPVSLATNEVDLGQRRARATFLGLKERQAVYHPETGCVLLPEAASGAEVPRLQPRREIHPSPAAYPYGAGAPEDSLFPEVDQRILERAVEAAFEGEWNGEEASRAVLVLYKDHLLAERYTRGFSKETKFQGWSMTKSLLNAMFGVLEQQGRISPAQTELFPEWEKDARAQISLHNLLQMNSGLEWTEDYTTISDVTNMLFLSRDMPRVQLEKQLVGAPGESWNYSSGTSNLLSGYLRQEFDTHQEYLDFWYSELIDRIGMHSMTLETDFKGTYVASSYSWATARDWAKFGLLYLHRGNWNGEQLFSESWADYTRIPTKGSEGAYGAHFWLNAGGQFPNVPGDMFSSNGFQGQHVFIIPSKDLVVVRFGLSEHPDFDIDAFLSGIVEAIE